MELGWVMGGSRGEMPGAPRDAGGKVGPQLQSCSLAQDPPDTGHSGGSNGPGSVDRAGPEPRDSRRKRHALGLPAVAAGSLGAETPRLRSAADVRTCVPLVSALRTPATRP